ncbi:MAG: hypoxanthine phosphoribosyltransferase [candidate division Zixibacteria bacterium]|nr:hypoxanthine phosphoribosyltransferase [candidate division Zixibacteria bacterium]
MEVLISAEQIRIRVQELARQIDLDFAEDTPVLIGMLKGSFIFVADLCRAMQAAHHIDFMALAAYGAGTSPSGSVRLLKDLSVNITGRSVIVVEDIVDSGTTVSYIRRLLMARQPRRLAVVALLDKRVRPEADLPIEYVGFQIGRGFVVGYGLDLAERYRHLPYIAQLDPNQDEETQARG